VAAWGWVALGWQAAGGAGAEGWGWAVFVAEVVVGAAAVVVGSAQVAGSAAGAVWAVVWVMGEVEVKAVKVGEQGMARVAAWVGRNMW
jgi:hypothetical protein